MKKVGTIMTSLLLSMLIITLSAGLSFVHCCHAGFTELAQAAEIEHEYVSHSHEPEDCCKDKSAEMSHDCNDIECKLENECKNTIDCTQHNSLDNSCMTVTTYKLTQSNIAHQQVFDFHQLPVIIPDFFHLITLNASPIIADAMLHDIPTGYKSPPKGYLHIIRILQI